jgi:hypothetical protein
MKPLPAASAKTTFFMARRNGALNGAMPAITPSGWRTAKPNWPGVPQGRSCWIAICDHKYLQMQMKLKNVIQQFAQLR